MTVIKRDNTREPFEKQKVRLAVSKAFIDVDGEETAYAKDKAREIAKQIWMKKDKYDWCEVQLSYAIGISEPLAIYIKTNLGDIEVPQKLYEECQVKNIIKDLKLLEENFENRSKFGHFKN